MASALKRMAGYLGLMDTEEVNNAADTNSSNSSFNSNNFAQANGNFRGAGETQPTVKLSRRERRAVSVVQPNSTPINPNATGGALDHIVSVTPRMYSEARVIGEHFRSEEHTV